MKSIEPEEQTDWVHHQKKKHVLRPESKMQTHRKAEAEEEEEEKEEKEEKEEEEEEEEKEEKEGGGNKPKIDRKLK